MKFFTKICAAALALFLLGGCVAHMIDRPLGTPAPTTAPAPAETPTAAPSAEPTPAPTEAPAEAPTAAPVIDGETVFFEFSELNLTEVMDQGFITRVFPCENGTLAVVSDKDGLALFGAYDPASGEVLFSGVELAYTNISNAGWSGESYFATFYDTTGDQIVTISPDGELLGTAFLAIGARHVTLSDTLTLREYMGDISVLTENGEVMLLDGEADVGDASTRYSICFAIDETRFAYVKYGWEWIDDAGICDAATGETVSIGRGMLPAEHLDGVLYLMQSGYDAPADLFAYDISSGELRELITTENIEDICYITPAASHIFYLTPNFEGEGSAELRVYSREGELRETHILECRGSTIQYIAALSDGCVLVYGEAYYGRDFFIYTLT